VFPLRRRYQRLGLLDRVKSVVVTPACGLGNVTWKSALIAISRTKEAARTLVEED
jgi:methionine synthase II (cobalamin-independent)